MVVMNVMKKATMTRMPLFQERRRGAEDGGGVVGLEEGAHSTASF
jgi:hypothetical protein